MFNTIILVLVAIALALWLVKDVVRAVRRCKQVDELFKKCKERGYFGRTMYFFSEHD